MASSSSALVEGPLSKWTNVVSGWQYRWFVLDQNMGLLSYYTSKEKMTKGSRRGCIPLKKAILGIDDEDDCTFTIHSDGRTFHFQAQNSEERGRWIQALESTLEHLKQHPSQQQESKISQVKKGLTIENRLAICESYYALLKEQITGLSDVLNSSEESDSIKQTSTNMLLAMKQCIDLMKDDELSESGSFHSFDMQQESLVPPGAGSKQKVIVEEHENDDGEDNNIDKDTQSKMTNDSISTDSDDFFDAEDVPNVVETIVTTPSLSVPLGEDVDSDIEDAEDYDEQDDVGSGVAANKSMITYMIGQVRIGMDLSRVTLPTFILEKRSLLEMYADFMAHPDLFVEINDFTTPKERMVAAVRYMLSAFHAARKGAVAKKPYNPILGEIFRCYWPIPKGERKAPNEAALRLQKTGPIPYSTYDSVTFIAEQVSHHPPISAFYAEYPKKRIYVSGSVYTKSRFLGLSLGVHNIGKVIVTLMDHDEEYEFTLPSAYARSILTYPWMEMGGKCQVKCNQTNYHADVEFHCKPFYGGKKHKVTAEIYEGNNRKPFMKVDGEWNGVMNVKHQNGVSTQNAQTKDEEVFVDTLNMPTIRKKIRHIDNQDSNESQRLWRDVTAALKDKNEQAATDAKHVLEEKQRADARERNELGIEWEQKHFYLDGEIWRYKHPLPNRMSQESQPLEQ